MCIRDRGNFVLRVVSTRLAETFGDGFVARGGGDEFVVWQLSLIHISEPTRPY